MRPLPYTLLPALLLALAAGLCHAQSAPVTPLESPGHGSFYRAWIQDRLSLGLSVSKPSLRETHRDADWSLPVDGQTFIGYINDLKEKSDPVLEISLRYEINRYLAVDLGLSTKAEFDVWNQDGLSCDGTFSYRDLSLGILLQYPLDDYCCAPYVKAAVLRTFCDMSTGTWWKTGWHDPRDYARYKGTGTDLRTAESRDFLVDDTTAFSLSLGVSAFLWRQLSMDVFGGHVFSSDSDAAVDCHYAHRRTLRTAIGAFPLDRSFYGLSVRYWF